MRQRGYGRGMFSGSKRTSDPLYGDVIQGRGGIAGGRFTLGGDTLDVPSLAYVVTDYIDGQSGYVEGP